MSSRSRAQTSEPVDALPRWAQPGDDLKRSARFMWTVADVMVRHVPRLDRSRADEVAFEVLKHLMEAGWQITPPVDSPAEESADE